MPETVAGRPFSPTCYAVAMIFYAPFFAVWQVERMLGNQISLLETRAEEQESKSAQHRALAMQATLRSDRKVALHELRQAKHYEKAGLVCRRQADALQSQSLALMQTTTTLEIADVQKQTLKILRRASKGGATSNLAQSMTDAGEIMEDIQDDVEDIEQVAMEMASNMARIDESELERELDELYEEALGGSPSGGGVGLPPEANLQPPAQTNEVSAQEEEELNRQLEQLQPLFPEVGTFHGATTPLMVSEERPPEANSLKVVTEAAVTL